MKPTRRSWRKIAAAARDTRVLVGQFRWPLLAFAVVVLGGGILYFLLSRLAGEPVQNLAEAIYVVLALIFFQVVNEFPGAWYLEVFYFIMPVIGLGIVAFGVADFGVSLFNRRMRSKEWEMAVASTFSNHIILVGLGHLGYRVVQGLYTLGEEVVAIELDPSEDLVNNVRGLNIPVIHADARKEATLEGAGVRRAKAITLCSQDDSMNLQIALKARTLNPEIRVILRIFDEDFGNALEHQFGFSALSATAIAAPSFAAAAAAAASQPDQDE